MQQHEIHLTIALMSSFPQFSGPHCIIFVTNFVNSSLEEKRKIFKSRLLIAKFSETLCLKITCVRSPNPNLYSVQFL